MPNTLRFGVVGPGRVGQALARRWVQAGHEFIGFLGRDAEHGTAASAACGLDHSGLASFEPLANAAFVLIAVDDDAIVSVAQHGADGEGVRPGALWLHCSGSVGLDALAPIEARGAGIGILHPLCPFPDAEQGFVGMVGRPAVLTGSSDTQPLLERLAHDLSMQPHLLPPGADRRRYHAACALAANGLTALCALVEGMFDSIAGEREPGVQSPMLALMESALEACASQGAQAALSGPVERGDAATVLAHLDALGTHDQELAVYRALMGVAADLASQRGRARPRDLAAIRRALAGDVHE